MTNCESSGKAQSSQEFDDSFYLPFKVLCCEIDFQIFQFVSKNCTDSLGVCSICRVVEIVDRYPFDTDKISGHVSFC